MRRLEIIVLSESEEILQAYTCEVHALYHQMADRAAMKLEVLPIEFLHQLTLRLNGQIELLAIRKDARIVAFASCLHAQSSYYTMYGGLDYHLNHKFDLYFNLVYALLDRGLQKAGFDHRVRHGLLTPLRPGSGVFPSRYTCS